MIRGILAGGLWGAAIGAVVVALISQLAEWRDLSPAVTAEETETEIAPEVPVAAADRTPTVVAGAERAPRVPAAVPQVEAGAADEITAPMLDTAPPATPAAVAPLDRVATALEAAEAPAAPAPVQSAAAEPPVLTVASVPQADLPPVEPSVDPAPAAPGTQAAAAPAAPEPEPQPEVTIVAEAAPVTAPGPTAQRRTFAAGPAPVLVIPDQGTRAPEPVAEASEPAVAVQEQAAEAPAEEPVQIPESVEPVQMAEAAPAPEPTPVPDPDPVEIAQAPVVVLPEPTPAPEPEAEVAPAPASDPETAAPEGAPRVLDLAQNTPSLPGQRVSRLPRIGVVATQSAPDEEPAVAAPEEAQDVELSALDRNRVEFEAPEGAGLIAVVLVHEGGPPRALEGGLAVPLTVAIPAGLPDAAQIAQAYQDAGYEIAVVPDLPPNPRAQDVEQSLPQSFLAVPQAVAVVDASGTGFQDSRGAAASVVAAVAETGHGLLTWPRGFNTTQKLAGEEGVPSALVFRDLAVGDAGEVDRVLEQAAFRARQEGGTVLVAPADPAVVEMLEGWSQETRRSDTVLAPLSAILLGG